MTGRSFRHAHWFNHVNAVNPPGDFRHWLTDRTSLTVKLVRRSEHFRVQCLRQGRGISLADEYATVGLSQREIVQEREVLLRCDERPVVYAHTIVPLTANASDWPFFNTLGERSLGSTLFGDPAVRRGALQFASLQPEHPLIRRACDTLGSGQIAGSLYARRCLFRRKKGVLLVTEVFLPGIKALDRSSEFAVAPVTERRLTMQESRREMTR